MICIDQELIVFTFSHFSKNKIDLIPYAERQVDSIKIKPIQLDSLFEEKIMGKIKVLIFEFWGAITQYETSEMLSLQGGI